MSFAIDPQLPPGLPREGNGSVVTVGTFDGVHRGHREVLQEIVRRAQRSGRRSVLVTFHPHPLRIVRPEAAPPLLTTLAEKKALLAESGLEYVVFLPFTRTLQQYSARRFVEEILIGRIGMRELVIGYDHGFGKGREGNVATMREISEEFGFAVDVVDAVDVGSEPVSSSHIREALKQGDVVNAARGLGRPYSIQGHVVRGAQRGRKLGFPTANIEVPEADKLLPAAGVYAVYGWVGGERLPGLLHRGPRPTFAGAPPSVELHLLDWQGDLYGQEVRVELCARIRDVISFGSLDELVAQLHRDEATGRALLAGKGGLSACATRETGL